MPDADAVFEGGGVKAELDRLLLEPAADGARGYERFKDRSLLDHIPGVGPLLNIGFEKGIYEGHVFEAWLRDLLAAKNKYTFADLKDTTEADPRYRYRLGVIASDPSRRPLLVLPQAIAVSQGSDWDPATLAVARPA